MPQVMSVSVAFFGNLTDICFDILAAYKQPIDGASNVSVRGMETAM